MESASLNDTRKTLLAACLLALVTLCAFLPVRGFDFVNYDDPEYVVENYHIRNGLTAEGVVWAFTHTHSNNWHPITWLSHMLDVELFGLEPTGHHIVNVLFHVLNTLLLFFFFYRATGARWRASVVAALFAWHPLHVQSVAWIAERKDVLSAFFAMLTLLCYLRFVEAKKNEAAGTGHRARKAYVLSFIFFLLGLMSKPMLVTMPALLFLLDVWPFKRVPALTDKAMDVNTKLALRKLLLEKLPFAIAVIVTIPITLAAQKDAINSLDKTPLLLRLQNAPIAVCKYLQQAFVPLDLAILYPFPAAIAWWKVIVAIAVIIAITFATFKNQKKFPFLCVGWAWFLISLLPVIGIIQVGSQRMADRYTYLPLIGIFVIVVWTLAELLPRRICAVIATLALVASLAATEFQLQFWQNDLMLFQRAASVTDRNILAYDHVADGFAKRNEPEKALSTYEQALALHPEDVDLMNNYGQLLARFRRFDEAIVQFRKVLAAKPAHARAYCNLGAVLLTVGQKEEGRRLLTKALELAPDDEEVHINFANVLLEEGKTAEALSHYLEAVRVAPKSAIAHYRAGRLLAKDRPQEAINHFDAAIHIRPAWTLPMNELAWLLATHPDASVRNGAKAVRLAEDSCAMQNYSDAKSLTIFDAALAEAGRFDDAITVADKSRELAVKAGQPELASAAEYRINLYRDRKPFRQQ